MARAVFLFTLPFSIIKELKGEFKMEQNEKQEKMQMCRHSLSHVLAKAIKNLYGNENVKLAIGPAIDNGFYYDFDMPSITADKYDEIEKEMKKILNANEPFRREELSREQALELFKNEPYKVELINDLPDEETISVYYLGDNFVDLCRGPHVENTSKLQSYAYKINRVSGAYWKGSEKNKMLQRVYVYAFPDKKQLTEYINQIEEAKKRDHRKLGKELDLFFFDETAPGMAYWLPKGFTMMNTLIDFWRKEHKTRDYLEFSAPQLNSSVLWKTSGHWDHYKEDMFVLTDVDGNEQALKPMNCPNSIKIYQSKMRSYKDLPLRLNDIDVIHRNEKSGQLNGLFRVRMFRQDDAHNFIRRDQIGSEIKSIIDLINKLYGVFDLPHILTLSTRPEDFMGEIETWNEAEKELKAVLNDLCGENNYRINEGDGAFYGPKIDIKMKDCLGREWQMGTIQLDFQLPERFDLTYVDSNGEKARPIMIHRAIFGSFERFIGIITEHFAGAFPLWLAPVQVRVMNISENSADYAQEIFAKLNEKGFRAEIDIRNEKIGYKIRECVGQKIPYMIIVGDGEKENGTISIRGRGNENQSGLLLDDFIARLQEEIKTFKK
ncbi:MAG: threonine--tRNA ligase [Clostridiales bacterium]|nr:threonine--tRNA ligase [Clostridiales bacterium]